MPGKMLTLCRLGIIDKAIVEREDEATFETFRDAISDIGALYGMLSCDRDG